MSKLDAKMFNSITVFSYQWILGDDIYEFLEQYPEFLSSKYSIVDLGSLTWDYIGTLFYSHSIRSSAKPAVDNDTPAELYCINYKNSSRNTVEAEDMSICIDTDADIDIRNDAYTSKEDFKAAMSGVYLIYKNNA